ncbi:unnamed protein product, partial [Staurois parvus]
PVGQILGGVSSSPVSRKDKPLITVVLSWAEGSATAQALVDSGAGGLFMDSSFAAQYSIPLQARVTPLVLEAIDGRPLQPPQVTHETLPVEVATSQGVGLFPGFLPRTTLWFWDIPLQKHNPTFDWWSAEILSWSPQFGAGCIRGPVKVLCASSDSVLPTDYGEYLDVFD